MKVGTAGNSILLIMPPFGPFDAPYISLAVLSGYLQSCNIKVGVFDASAFLVKKFCERSRIEKGLDAVRRSFLELNAKNHLTPSEAGKMTILYQLIHETNQLGLDRLPPETALQLAAFPFWPDCLVKRPLLKLMTATSIFASNDLLQAASKEYFFTAHLRQELQRTLAQNHILIAGISTVFDEHMPTALHCARLIKELAPHVHVTMGGPFITTHMDELDNPDFFRIVDSLIFDEGELPLQRLYEEISSGSPQLDNVPGFMHLSAEGTIRKNASMPAPDMETLAFADYAACNLDQYPHPPTKMQLAVRLSRGCYWQRCSFCRINLSFCKNFQQPSVDRVFAEIEHLVHSTGVNKFLFSDESSHPLVLEKLCRKILDARLQIEWSFHTRIDTKLTKERVKLYRDAGCKKFHVGIETFNNRLLQVLRKGISEEVIEEVLAEIQGILPIHAYMIVGIPGETEKEANRSYAITQEYLKKGIIQGAIFSLFQLMPGSDMWNDPGKYRIKLLEPTLKNDLKPNICANLSVEGGMTRNEAFTLFIRYNFPRLSTREKPSETLKLAGETIACRYPFEYLRNYLHNSLIHQNDLPFQRWLAFLDETHVPVLPFRSTQCGQSEKK